MELIRLWTTLKRRKWVVVQAFLFFTVASLVATRFLPKTYSATAKVMIEQSDATASLLSEVGLEELVTTLGSTGSNEVSNKIALATINENLEEVVWRLQLRDEDGYLVKAPTLLKKSIFYSISPTPLYSIQQYQNTDILMITATAPYPEQAQMMADALAEVFIDVSQQRTRAETRSAKEFIEDRIGVVEHEFDKALADIADYQSAEGIIDLQTETREAVAKIAELMTLSEGNEYKISQLRRQITEVEQFLAANTGVEVDGGTLRENPQIASLTAELNQMYLELDRMLQDKTEAHPDVAEFRALIVQSEERLNSLLAMEADRSPGLTDLRLQLTGAVQTRRDIQDDIAQYTAEFAELPDLMKEDTRLQLAAQASQTILEELTDYQYQIGIAEAMTLTDIRIVDPAVLPDRPASPKLLYNAVLGAFLGIVVGFVLVFLLEYIDDSIRTREDLEEVFDVPHLGVVPNIRPGEGKFIHTLNPKAPLSEAYRTVRNNILYASFEKPVQTLMITSSVPGEGKSTTCANLAASAAMEGKRVLLIDTDFRKPNQHRLWQAENSVGFTTYLAGQAPLEECIHSNVIPGLDLLPSGMVPPNPAKLIESTRLKETLALLRESYDLVLLDSPPILVVNDAMALCRIVDAYVLVVESMGVSRRMLADARSRIDMVGVPPVGAVLNKLDFGTAGYGYYYKYYHAYEKERVAGGGDGKRRGMRVVEGGPK